MNSSEIRQTDCIKYPPHVYSTSDLDTLTILMYSIWSPTLEYCAVRRNILQDCSNMKTAQGGRGRQVIPQVERKNVVEQITKLWRVFLRNPSTNIKHLLHPRHLAKC